LTRGRKRVAILTNFPADLSSFSGGVETVTAYLLEGFAQCSHEFELHVVSLSKAVEKDMHVRQDGVEFHFLAVPRNFFLKPHMPYNILKCMILLNRIKPDLVHCQDNVALALAAAVLALSRIFTVHGVRRAEAKVWKGSAYWSHQADRVIEWLVHRRYRYFIGASPYVSALLGPAKRVFIIPNPISRLFFDAGRAVSRRYPREILFIGSLIHLKQVHVLIEAYEKLLGEFKDMRLTICGGTDDEKYRGRLMEMAGKNGLTGIRFLQDLRTADVLELMNRASVLVLPSLQENSPVTIAEAMAAGLPVAASRAGGIPYMIEHGKSGMLFKAGNAEELAACVKAIFTVDGLAERIRTAAREKAVSCYQAKQVAQKTLEVYRNIIER
jgi:glycosyltransferase involved in cell wall biosynthesis